jgi:hypothetical protein
MAAGAGGGATGALGGARAGTLDTGLLARDGLDPPRRGIVRFVLFCGKKKKLISLSVYEINILDDVS